MSLMKIHPMNRVKARQIFLVFTDDEQVDSPFQLVLPFLESHDHCQQLLHTHIVVSLSRG